MSDAFRLPATIAPSHYDLEITPDLAGERFAGRASITIDVTDPTSEVVCNAAELTITEATIDGEAVQFDLDPDAELLRLHTPRALAPGSHVVDISFRGEFNQQLVGFYGSRYADAAGTHVLGVTQFEAPYARHAFPCWDEPAFKATFDVTLVVPDSLLAVSNAAEIARDPRGDGTVAVRFGRTIPMSTYLVAWVVGRLGATEPVDVDGIPVRVVCRPGQEHRCREAVRIAAHSLRWFSAYYGIPYPGDKLDLVALPDFGFGAMENLGCITFREVLLILDPEELTQAELERAATVIAHEIAHMWFGDLVTMRWWDGIWLNEAFATFMELECIDADRPEWSVWTTFGQARSHAFTTDATTHTRPIEFEVATPADAEAMFDVLTYEKGASVLRMVQQHVGAGVFRDGIRRYLDRHRYANTETSDLWAALDEVSDTPVSEVMTSWIGQGGHPVVSGTVSGGRIRLRQRRAGFGVPDDARWQIPVRLHYGTGDHRVLEHKVLLRDDEVAVELAEAPTWVCLNADGVGFYRSNYDPAGFSALCAAVDVLHPLERFGLIDDAWALMVGGETDVGRVLHALDAVGRDRHPAVLRRVAQAMGELRLVAGPAGAPAVEALARRLGEGRADDPEVDAILLRLAGWVGADPAAVDLAASWLAASDRGEEVHPERLAAAIEVTAGQADEAGFDDLVQRYRAAASPQDELRYLSALTRVGDPDLQDRLLQMCATEVRTQNAPYTLAQAMGHPRVGHRAWAFVRDRWDELVARFPTNSIPRMVGGVRSLWESATQADVAAFFEVPRLAHSERQVAQHLEVMAAHGAARDRERARLVELLA